MALLLVSGNAVCSNNATNLPIAPQTTTVLVNSVAGNKIGLATVAFYLLPGGMYSVK